MNALHPEDEPAGPLSTGGARRTCPRFGRSLVARLALAVFGAVALAMAAAAAFGLVQEIDRYAEAKRESLETIAQVFAAASAPAVEAGDASAAMGTLSAIARRPDLVYAGIERLDGTTLADQGLAIRLASDVDLDRAVSAFALVGSRTAEIRVPILHGGRNVGTMVLVADTTDLGDRLLSILKGSALGSVLALGIGLAVSFWLQRSITQPIAALARTMDAVRTRQDYDQTARIVRDDEVGSLALTFNDLLGTVRERDRRLARHMERLEQTVAERTADLHEAKVAAEDANTAKSSFLATMSHEIRTPLNGMLVMAELLASSDLPDRQRRHAEVIAKSGQGLLAIINDILDFAKVEAGKVELEHIALEPADVVDTVVSLFAEKAREKGLDLAAHVAADVPRFVLGDPVRLGQILSNFVNNALKFTSTGSVLIRITRAGPGNLRLSVRDTGIGIPGDKVGTIFSAFSQADQSTTRQFGGTGLGLSIAQRLAVAMGGTMGVDSVFGEGSTFWTEIPLEADGSAALPAIVKLPQVEGRVVVDTDRSATGEILRDALREAGFTPIAADDPDAGSAHWIVDAGRIAGLGRRPSSSGRVLALSLMGDAAAALVDGGWADEILRWPLVQGAWSPILSALATGRPFDTPSRSGSAVVDALPRFPGLRVLVADDSAVNREVAIEALARCGVTVVATAEDGSEAVLAQRTHGFDLILMDGSMPVLDGYAAALAIRAEERENGSARVPIVALTAHVIGPAAEAWRAADMDGTLTKPFSLQGLARTLAAFQPAALDGASIVADAVAPVAETGDEGDLLDEEVVGGLVDMASQAGSGFAGRIVGLYEEHAPTALAVLRTAMEGNDARAVAHAAHSLKSMSLNIGGRLIARRLAAIEGSGTIPTEAELVGIETLLDATVSLLRSRILGDGAAILDPPSRLPSY